MFDAVDERLMGWIQAATDIDAVSLEPPGGDAEPSRIHAYFFDLEPGEGRSVDGKGERHVWLRYLLTSTDPDPLQAHRRLGDIVFAALQSTELQVEADPPSLELWRALGTVPRPGLVVRLKASAKPEARHEGPPVLHPMELRLVASGPVHGVVATSTGYPLPHAEVEIPSEGLRARTDGNGTFRFAKVPTRAHARRLIVRVKGKENVFKLAPGATDGGTLRVELD